MARDVRLFHIVRFLRWGCARRSTCTRAAGRGAHEPGVVEWLGEAGRAVTTIWPCERRVRPVSPRPRYDPRGSPRASMFKWSGSRVAGWCVAAGLGGCVDAPDSDGLLGDE